MADLWLNNKRNWRFSFHLKYWYSHRLDFYICWIKKTWTHISEETVCLRTLQRLEEDLIEDLYLYACFCGLLLPEDTNTPVATNAVTNLDFTLFNSKHRLKWLVVWMHRDKTKNNTIRVKRLDAWGFAMILKFTSHCTIIGRVIIYCISPQ